MIRAHKIRLNPNNKQKTLLLKSCGVARFSYNWALSEWKRQYTEYVKDPTLPRPSEGALRKQLNSIKKTKFPWMLEVSKCAPQCAIINLGEAFSRFFQKKAKYPVFHKKTRKCSFSFDNVNFKVTSTHINIPRIGSVRICEPLRFSGKVMGCTVSKTADQWYVSVQVEVPDTTPETHKGPEVGIDFGATNFATISTGEKFTGPKPHKRLLGRLKRLNKSLSRKKLGSRNRFKAKVKLSKLHNKIGCIRNDFIHKFTTDICRRYSLVGIENLNVKGMVKTTLARSILDQAPFEMKRQLSYKAPAFGSVLFTADRFFPSSKLCSCCGHKLDFLPLELRTWTCPKCNTCHDRDTNAAINLRNKAGESRRLQPVEHLALVSGLYSDTKLGAVKQEETAFRYGSKW